MVMPQNEISEDLQHLSHEFPPVQVVALTINAYRKTVSLSMSMRVGKGIFGNRSQFVLGQHKSACGSSVQPRLQVVSICFTIMAQGRGE